MCGAGGRHDLACGAHTTVHRRCAGDCAPEALVTALAGVTLDQLIKDAERRRGQDILRTDERIPVRAVMKHSRALYATLRPRGGSKEGRPWGGPSPRPGPGERAGAAHGTADKVAGLSWPGLWPLSRQRTVLQATGFQCPALWAHGGNAGLGAILQVRVGAGEQKQSGCQTGVGSGPRERGGRVKACRAVTARPGCKAARWSPHTRPTDPGSMDRSIHCGSAAGPESPSSSCVSMAPSAGKA